MVAELYVTGDREFQTAGAIMLNAMDWKLMLVTDRPTQVYSYVKGRRWYYSYNISAVYGKMQMVVF